eukprot:359453-Chlamydomonas_euryale.AAC.5
MHDLWQFGQHALQLKRCPPVGQRGSAASALEYNNKLLRCVGGCPHSVSDYLLCQTGRSCTGRKLSCYIGRGQRLFAWFHTIKESIIDGGLAGVCRLAE